MRDLAMIILGIVAAVYAVAIVITVRALKHAPLGRETAEGFEEIESPESADDASCETPDPEKAARRGV